MSGCARSSKSSPLTSSGGSHLEPNEPFNENHDLTAQDGNQNDSRCPGVPGSVRRMQLRAEVCEASSPNARSLQGTACGAIQRNRRLEDSGAQGRSDSRSVVGDIPRLKKDY